MTAVPPDYESRGTPLAAPARRGRPAGVVAGVVVAAALLAIGGFALVSTDDDVTPATVALCEPVRERAALLGNAQHDEGTIEYVASPPVGGPHNPTPLPARPAVVRPGEHVVERAVHNLEHGYVVVWYDTEASRDEIDAAERAVRDAGLPKVLVVPWERETFLGDFHVVMTAWEREQGCAGLDAAALTAFWDGNGGENGVAPEKAAP